MVPAPRTPAEGELSLLEGTAGLLLYLEAETGQVTHETLSRLSAGLNRVPLFHDRSRSAASQAMETALSLARLGEMGSLLHASARAVPDGLEDTLFALVCDLSVASGKASGEVREALADVREALGLSSRLADDILTVIQIKNRRQR